MDGMHDLGGKEGFGKVDYRPGGPVYHASWHERIHALSSLARRLGIFNMDEYRHAIERMAPRHYLAASYYERVLIGSATLCVEKGCVEHRQLARWSGDDFPLSGAIGPGRLNKPIASTFSIGDVLRVKDEHVSCHVRVPGYVRGKTGTVVGRSPASPFPDASAHDMPALSEPTYQLRFLSTELWPGASEEASVYVDLFQSYLEPCTGAP
ncbi:MAG TPA: SH3-like domain-containing protein [Burkholderiaceae bacterium]|nr:SH3-like domain-containing protein [Burkholderiaceae bacterium]